jgi:hypothetical protein
MITLHQHISSSFSKNKVRGSELVCNDGFVMKLLEYFSDVFFLPFSITQSDTECWNFPTYNYDLFTGYIK